MTTNLSTPSTLQAEGASLRLQGHQARLRGDYGSARGHYLSAVDAYQRAGDPEQAGHCLLDLAKLAELDGDPRGGFEAAFLASAAGAVAKDRLLIHLATNVMERLHRVVEPVAQPAAA